MNFEPFKFHGNQIALGFLFFIVGLVVSTCVTIFVLVRLPANYFLDNSLPADLAQPRWLRILRKLLKNIIGVALVILGLVMALPGVPGQGLLTMFIGIVLLDLPGKREFEKRIVSKPTILHACNRLRARFGKEPLLLEIVSQRNNDAHDSVTSERNDDHGRVK